ncbi:MAG TPA: hypothetical protein VJU61_03620, partial [Polyangiaceae bacterium]|nr:hypothetical protein [Polyangiaceae bacterium]
MGPNDQDSASSAARASRAASSAALASRAASESPQLSQGLVALLRFLDQRSTTVRTRSRDLLITEISGLERLYARTSADSPDRQQMLFRLAEAYGELRVAAVRDEATTSAPDAAAALRKTAHTSSVNAAKYGERLIKDYPGYSRLDEAFYYLALEYGWQNSLDRMRANLLQVVEHSPASRYVPAAHFAFGELFRLQAATDPSALQLAKASFEEALTFPPAKNFAYCASSA